jgi:hypothetical protein
LEAASDPRQNAEEEPVSDDAWGKPDDCDLIDIVFDRVDAGATSNKEPSLRPEWRADYFAANIGDPDGYNIEIAYKPWLYK